MLKRLESIGEFFVIQLINVGNFDDLLDLAWEKMHCGAWNQVDLVWRELYAFAALGKAKSRIFEQRELFKILDLALMMGAGEFREEVKKYVDRIENQLISSESLATKKLRKCVFDDAIDSIAISESNSIKRIKCSELSLIQFVEIMKRQEPVIIMGLVDDWPAFSGDKSWRNIENLIRMAWHRYVPVEVGEHYASDQWAQTMMYFVR
jgi:lysine-specific demethylase 8